MVFLYCPSCGVPVVLTLTNLHGDPHPAADAAAIIQPPSADAAAIIQPSVVAPAAAPPLAMSTPADGEIIHSTVPAPPPIAESAATDTTAMGITALPQTPGPIAKSAATATTAMGITADGGIIHPTLPPLSPPPLAMSVATADGEIGAIIQSTAPQTPPSLLSVPPLKKARPKARTCRPLSLPPVAKGPNPTDAPASSSGSARAYPAPASSSGSASAYPVDPAINYDDYDFDDCDDQYSLYDDESDGDVEPGNKRHPE
jgi:hypothetical protein